MRRAHRHHQHTAVGVPGFDADVDQPLMQHLDQEGVLTEGVRLQHISPLAGCRLGHHRRDVDPRVIRAGQQQRS